MPLSTQKTEDTLK